MKTGIPLGRFAASVPLVVLVSLTGCKTWQPIEASPAPWIVRERPQEVRVTTESGARMTLRSPVVANDSIVSPVEGLPVLPRRGVALADLRTLEVARFNAVKSAALCGRHPGRLDQLGHHCQSEQRRGGQPGTAAAKALARLGLYLEDLPVTRKTRFPAVVALLAACAVRRRHRPLAGPRRTLRFRSKRRPILLRPRARGQGARSSRPRPRGIAYLPSRGFPGVARRQHCRDQEPRGDREPDRADGAPRGPEHDRGT